MKTIQKFCGYCGQKNTFKSTEEFLAHLKSCEDIQDGLDGKDKIPSPIPTPVPEDIVENQNIRYVLVPKINIFANQVFVN